MARILVVEDDQATAEEISTELAAHGHDVETAHDGAYALDRALAAHFDVVTLDRMLPDTDGLAVLEELRRANIQTPVLMISALGDVDDRIAGLRAGGDDYLTKPFATNEMAMRVEVLIRRNRQVQSQAELLKLGPVTINLRKREVLVEGKPVRLLHKEFALLEFLARNAGDVISRKIIFEQVWGYYFDPGPNLINVHIGRLRKKLDTPGRSSLIETVKGEGYRFHAG